jgi:hypothetical protein
MTPSPLLRAVSVLGALALSCCSPGGEISLELSAVRLINDGSDVRVVIVGSRQDGTLGVGTIALSASAGQLAEKTLVLDNYGTAQTRYSCDKKTDERCLGAVELTAQWSGATSSSAKTSSATISIIDPPARVLGFVGNGCERVAAPRPASTGTLDAPKVATVSIPDVVSGQGFPGLLAFEDTQNDEEAIIVQLSSEAAHWVCPLSAFEKANHLFNLARLALEAGFPDGVYLLYLSARDAAGNVGGYSVATLSVGVGQRLNPCAGFAFQLMGSAPSGSTQFYTRANGVLQTYGRGGTTGERLTIVYRATIQVDLGGCSRLRLMSKPSGGPVGWDNCLVIEARVTPGGPATAAWSYCSNDTAPLYDVLSGAPVRRPSTPTVVGNRLVPKIPSPNPFGFESGALDIISELPPGLRVFELSMYVGSTTEVWLVP